VFIQVVPHVDDPGFRFSGTTHTNSPNAQRPGAV
jgi:hypothetical protein